MPTPICAMRRSTFAAPLMALAALTASDASAHAAAECKEAIGIIAGIVKVSAGAGMSLRGKARGLARRHASRWRLRGPQSRRSGRRHNNT
jgi:hypothetical protein